MEFSSPTCNTNVNIKKSSSRYCARSSRTHFLLVTTFMKDSAIPGLSLPQPLTTIECKCGFMSSAMSDEATTEAASKDVFPLDQASSTLLVRAPHKHVRTSKRAAMLIH